MKKKYLAHTFAELMISLVVVSVIAALVYPMLVKFNPDTNKPLFQAAYRTLTIVISEIVHANLDGELAQQNGNALSANLLCQEFCARANVVLDENIYKKLANYKNIDKTNKNLILKNAKIVMPLI